MYASTELDCACTAKVLTIRTFRNGSQHYAFQCITCGATDKNLKKVEAESLIQQGEKLETYDEGAADRYRSMLRTMNDITRSDLKAQRQQEYKEYLQSPGWAQKRQLVIRRCKNVCEGCHSRPVAHIHHLTYEHIYSELLFELVGLCKSCHRVIHPEVANG